MTEVSTPQDHETGCKYMSSNFVQEDGINFLLDIISGHRNF